MRKKAKATEEHGKQLTESNALVKNDYDSKYNYKLILKEKKIYDKLVAERNNELNTLSQKTRYD